MLSHPCYPPSSDVSPFGGESAAALSKEVEEEANSNFQRIYNHPPHPTLSIEEVLDMLKRFQDSSVPRERVSHWARRSERTAGRPDRTAGLE